jgi:hypothetical protein
MRELELVAEYDRPRGLIIPGDPFQEHPGRRYAHVPGRKPDDCDGGWEREPFLPRRPLRFAIGSLTCHDK